METKIVAYIAKAQWKKAESTAYEERTATEEQAREEVRYFKKITTGAKGWKYGLYKVEERVTKIKL